jgi:addiction module HigA family antidote
MGSRLKPIHPGFILLEDFMEPLGISQNKLSLAIGVDVRRINSIVQGKRAITPDTALRLGVYLKTGPKVWLNLQQEYDLRIAEREIEAVLKKIEPAKTAAA